MQGNYMYLTYIATTTMEPVTIPSSSLTASGFSRLLMQHTQHMQQQ